MPFTRAQIWDCFGPARLVSGRSTDDAGRRGHGNKPGVVAGSLCHYPNGKGSPEKAGVAGLPVCDSIQTMIDLRDRILKGTDPRKTNTNRMIIIAKELTEGQTGRKYSGSMKRTPSMKVAETAMVPKTRTAGGMFLTLEGNETMADRRDSAGHRRDRGLAR